MPTPAPVVNLDHLLKLRLAVARVGEMDNAGWWNTKGMLGSMGATVLKRGFPSTHLFAQAKVVFAVARARCRELYQPTQAVTLWDLPAELEDQFEDRWHDWLEQREAWQPFFSTIAGHQGQDLLGLLKTLELVDAGVLDEVARLKRSAENRAVALPGSRLVDDTTLTLLAAAFSRGEPGSPAIPYARVEG